MKLRNEQTGEIKTSDKVGLLGRNGKNVWSSGEYGSLAPLIKDEKTRKVVRAWAECCCIPLVKHYLSNGLSCFICNDEEDNEYCLDFTFCINNLEAEHIYSIKELCGEEEE